jgi:hypothetical protein
MRFPVACLGFAGHGRAGFDKAVDEGVLDTVLCVTGTTHISNAQPQTLLGQRTRANRAVLRPLHRQDGWVGRTLQAFERHVVD